MVLAGLVGGIPLRECFMKRKPRSRWAGSGRKSLGRPVFSLMVECKGCRSLFVRIFFAGCFLGIMVSGIFVDAF